MSVERSESGAAFSIRLRASNPEWDDGGDRGRSRRLEALLRHGRHLQEQLHFFGSRLAAGGSDQERGGARPDVPNGRVPSRGRLLGLTPVGDRLDAVALGGTDKAPLAQTSSRTFFEEDDEAALRGVKVLLAEDDQLNRRLIAVLLSLTSAAVEGVADGVAAWNRLAADPHAFHLVILDDFMGGGDCDGAGRSDRWAAPVPRGLRALQSVYVLPLWNLTRSHSLSPIFPPVQVSQLSFASMPSTPISAALPRFLS